MLLSVWAILSYTPHHHHSKFWFKTAWYNIHTDRGWNHAINTHFNSIKGSVMKRNAALLGLAMIFAGQEDPLIIFKRKKYI